MLEDYVIGILLIFLTLIYILYTFSTAKNKELNTLIEKKDTLINQLYKGIEQEYGPKTGIIKEKDALIIQLHKEIEQKYGQENKIIKEKGAVIIQLHEEIEQKYEKETEIIKEKHALIKRLNIETKENCEKQVEILKLKRSLERAQLEILHASKKLSARGALEMFQQQHVFKGKKEDLQAEDKWEMFLNEDLGKEFAEKMRESNCTMPIPEIAKRVYSVVSEGIHNYFDEEISKLYLIQSELGRLDLIFLKTVCSLIPLSPSDVIVLKNKAQFTYLPPRMW